MGVMAHTQRASQNNAQVAYMMGMNGMTPAPQQAQRQIAGRPGGLGIGVAQNMMQTVMPGGPGQGQMAHFTGRPMPRCVFVEYLFHLAHIHILPRLVISMARLVLYRHK
jgi:hypothetical protein